MTLRNPQPGQDLIDALEASSSMPFISKPHNTSKGLCLDGGIANSIPFDIAQKIATIGFADVYKRHSYTARARTILENIKPQTNSY